MRFLQSYWCPVCLGLMTIIALVMSAMPSNQTTLVKSIHSWYRENEEWIPPSESEIPPDGEGDLIRYGKELIAHTSQYLGPKGIVAHRSNGMNCQNCHIDAGSTNFANPFSAVASIYPRYRERSGRTESIEFRINECMQRSLNGTALDSLSLEMRSMVAYLKWIGSEVPKGVRPKGAGTESLPFLDRAADPLKGKFVYEQYCARCHGANGEGQLMANASEYTYPPLWGEHSYNVSAGMYRLSGLAGFIKNNMPFGTTWKEPQLTAEQAWDVAAYINSQERPQKFFSYDWKNISKKPFDYPFGPFSDSFPAEQHKYGPFGKMKK